MIAASASNAAVVSRPAHSRSVLLQGSGTFLAGADCPLDPHKDSRYRHAFRVSLRMSPRSCRSGRQCSYSSRSSATCLERRMCPASPQSITRCAMLIPAPGEIGPTVHIDHTADRPAVHAHSKLQAWMFLERAADLQRALHRRFRTRVKDQAPSRRRSQFLASGPRLRPSEIAPSARTTLVQFLNRRVLVVNRELGVTNDVDEQDMRDLRAAISF